MTENNEMKIVKYSVIDYTALQSNEYDIENLPLTVYARNAIDAIEVGKEIFGIDNISATPHRMFYV